MTEGNVSWETTSGLPDDFDGTISTAEFGTRANYMNGEMTLLILGIDSGDMPMEHLVSIGEGWQIREQGAMAIHPTNSGFSENSVYGKMIDRCTKELGMAELLGSRGKPDQADVWIGITMHWKREMIDYGSNIESKERLMPTAFIGVADAGEVASPKATETDELDPKEKLKRAREAKKAGELEETVLDALATVAKDASSFEEFQDTAVDIDGLPGDLLDQILDDEQGPAMYAEMQGG